MDATIAQGKNLPNYLAVFRRKSGLTQSELGKLLGYEDQNTVGRHEKSQAIPTLDAAIKYEIVFRVPVGEIFIGLHDLLTIDVEMKLAQFHEHLGTLSARDLNASSTARKLIWLAGRKNPKE